MDQISPDVLMVGFTLLVFAGLSFPHLESWWEWIKFRFGKGADHESR